jgi:hypothetical protein
MTSGLIPNEKKELELTGYIAIKLTCTRVSNEQPETAGLSDF